jgi:hypothetical protein
MRFSSRCEVLGEHGTIVVYNRQVGSESVLDNIRTLEQTGCLT